MKKDNRKQTRTATVGLDLGDKWTHWCELDADGGVVGRGRIRTTREALQKSFGERTRLRVILENGTHARWVDRMVGGFGHEVIVANPRKVKLIYQDSNKHDRKDAESLARLGRFDVALLAPIHFRGEAAQRARALLKGRDALVRSRTLLINQVRGVAKASGYRLHSCSAESFYPHALEPLPGDLKAVLEPVGETIQMLTRQIRVCDRRCQQMAEQNYPETQRLRQVRGVGAITALAFVATIEDPQRFRRARDVGPYLGFTPCRDQSGERERLGRITKEGDEFLRRLLVGSAHYIVGPFGPDCDLRRGGVRLKARGGQDASKKAVVAVARKLGVLLLHLWKTGEVYEPLYNSNRMERCA